MAWLKVFGTLTLVFCLSVGTAMAGTVSMKLSGPGAVNDSTIKAGEKVSVDIYVSNDTIRKGISVGFKLVSDDIKKVIHVADSGNGLTEQGDIKGFNGWQDKSVFDFTGVIVSLCGAADIEKCHTWDGILPDTVGFACLVIKKEWQPHPSTKQLALDLIIPEPGTLVIDSSFFPPGGDWMYDNEEMPAWEGPYKFTVIK